MSRAVSPELHFGNSKLQSLNTFVKAIFNSQSTQKSPKHLQKHSNDGSLTILSSHA